MAQHFDPEQGEILSQIDFDDQQITVRQIDHIRWLHFRGEAIQSLVDTRFPYFPKLAYAQAMSLALCFVGLPEKILSLGMGGATLERLFAYYSADVSIDSIELVPEISAIARQFFGLPEQACVHHADAMQFLQNTDNSYQLICCDLFGPEGLSPLLEQDTFYEACARRAFEHTLLVTNVIPDDDQQLLSILISMRKTWPHVAAIEVPRHRNIILFCSREPLEAQEVVCSRLKDLGNRLGFDAAPFGGLLNYLPPRT